MRKTPLRDVHESLGARFVDFFGWEMPVQYAGILEETRCVRNQVGLFDLCHMGRIEVTGPDRDAFVDRVFSGRYRTLKEGRAKYGFLLNDDGYPIDDVLVYREATMVHIVINATGRDKDLAWIESKKGDLDVTLREVSDEQAMIALQGPASAALLQTLCETDLATVRYYSFTRTKVHGTECLMARTGYTGEDGFELFFDPAQATTIWNALLEHGAEHGAQAIGLGARDILRLEAGMPLYGNEINLEIDPLEADLRFGLDFRKEDGVGLDALRARAEAGPERIAISLACDGGRVARAGALVCTPDGTEIGIVTSGGVSPTVGKNIARALVPVAHAEEGTALAASIRGRLQPMTVVPHPFYTRSS